MLITSRFVHSISTKEALIPYNISAQMHLRTTHTHVLVRGFLTPEEDIVVTNPNMLLSFHWHGDMKTASEMFVIDCRVVLVD